MPFVVANVALLLVTIVFGLHVRLRRVVTGGKLAAPSDTEILRSPTSRLVDSISHYISKVGGPTIFVYKIFRLATLSVLLALSLVTSFKYGWRTPSIVLIETLARADIIHTIQLVTNTFSRFSLCL